MRIDILTLFPEIFGPFLDLSIIGRARASGIVDIRVTNIRDFATDSHRSVDDRPFGGGPGMIMMCEPLFRAVETVGQQTHPQQRILLTPQGKTFTQAVAAELAATTGFLLICGHYEGFDERIRTGLDVREISIGDYVLSGGEAAAMVLVDAVVRLRKGALGNETAPQNDSFSSGLLEYPQYTRPREFRGMQVPEILLSGDHERIRRWRHEQAVHRTRQRRPDLLEE